MTRTDPPDILDSAVYQDVKVTLNAHSQVCGSSAQCDSFMSNHQDFNQPQFNKRHCRSFDFLESFDDQLTTTPTMDNYQRGTRRRADTPEPSNQPIVRKSSVRADPQYISQGMDTSKETAKEPRRRPRSKSAPRVKTTFSSVPIQMSSSQSPPPTARRGREAVRTSREPQKSVASPKKEVTYGQTKVLMNEVHPIKLQPQRNSASRISPLCVSNNCMEEPQVGKPMSSPHVRCRVDIKPDDAAIQHAAHAAKTSQTWGEGQYCTRQPGTPRSLAVPNARLMSVSRTPTPSDSYSVDPRMTHFACTPGQEMYGTDVRAIPYQGVASPRDFVQYNTRDCGQYVTPSIPTTYYYADEDGNLAQIPVKPRGYYPRPYPDPAISAHSYYEENPMIQPRAYYIEDPRSYPIQEAPIRTFYSEDPRFYPPRTGPGKSLYSEDTRSYPLQSTSSKLYYSEDISKYSEREALSRTYPYPRAPSAQQPLQFSEWYFPDQSPISYQTIQMSPFPTQTTGREAMLSSWHASYSMNQQRLANDSRNYSRSWDNILNTGGRKEDPLSRGRSYENLLCRERCALSPDDRRQPVVVNLSCSPKRYAALSLSENSLVEKVHTDAATGRYTMGRSWFVTPEITITDNDLRGNGVGRNERRSASWDVIDSGVSPTGYPTHIPYPTKEKMPSRSSRHRSLEQLDELIADLVIDYKPPTSRRPSEADALADQLRKLIKEDMIGIPRKSEPYGPTSHHQNRPLKEQPTPSFPEFQRGQRRGAFPEVPVSSPHKPLEDCSPDLSADEDDLLICSNAKCGRTETMFNACLYFKSCHSCYTYYCSRNCRREDWDIHKSSCIYGRMGSVCRHVLKFCRENNEVHKAFSRIAKVGYLSRGRGVLFFGFPNPGSADNFLQLGLEGLLMSPTYLSLRELESYSDNLGEHAKELQIAGNQYDPEECFLLNVTVAVGQSGQDRLSSRAHHVPTIRKYAKIALASSSPERKITKKEDMETLILTPPPGTADLDKEGEEGRKAREVCFIHIQRELRMRGVFLRHEHPKIYQQLCEFVENNKRFTPTTIYPIDKRTGKQFMCMIMAASEPRTLDWVASPNLLDDLM